MKRNEIFWALVLIGVGVLLLVGQFAGLSVWQYIWPLFLIAAGLWVILQTVGPQPEIEAEKAALPSEGYERAHLRIEHGLGTLNLRAGAGPGLLAAGTFEGGLDHRARERNGGVEVELRTSPEVTRMLAVGPFFARNRNLNWELLLNREITYTLDVQAGLSKNDLDLSDLAVTELKLASGLSSTEVILPASGHVKATIEAGLGSVTVRIPEGMAARIRVDGGLSSISVDGQRFPRIGGVHQSPGFETAENRIELEVKAGLGSLSVR